MLLDLSSQKLALPAAFSAKILATAATLFLLVIGVLDTGASLSIARNFGFASSFVWFFALLFSAGLHLVLSRNNQQSWKYWLAGSSVIVLAQIAILIVVEIFA